MHSPAVVADVGNHSNTSLTEQDCCSTGAEAIVVPVFFSVIFILGSIGNVLVIIVIMRKRRRAGSTTGNVFMINLAIADLLFLVFCIPFHAVIYTLPNWPFGEAMCKSVHFMQYASMMASILTLVAMSIDRYLAVSFPIRRKFAKNNALVAATCVAIWLAALAVASPWPVFYTVRIYKQHGPTPLHICADDWGARRQHRPLYFVILFVIGYAIPLLVIFLLSVLTLYNLWATKTPIRTNQSEGVKNKRKATRLVVALVGIFALSWLPFHINWLWASYPSGPFENNYVFYYLRVVGFIMSYANSMLNPLVYAFISQNFRRAFIRSVACRKGVRGNNHDIGRVSVNTENALCLTRCTNDFEYNPELELDPVQNRRSLKMKILARNLSNK